MGSWRSSRARRILTDDVGVELVGQASASVLADEVRGQLVRPGEQWVQRDLDRLGHHARSA